MACTKPPNIIWNVAVTTTAANNNIFHHQNDDHHAPHVSLPLPTTSTTHPSIRVTLYIRPRCQTTTFATSPHGRHTKQQSTLAGTSGKFYVSSSSSSSPTPSNPFPSSVYDRRRAGFKVRRRASVRGGGAWRGGGPPVTVSGVEAARHGLAGSARGEAWSDEAARRRVRS